MESIMLFFTSQAIKDRQCENLIIPNYTCRVNSRILLLCLIYLACNPQPRSDELKGLWKLLSMQEQENGATTWGDYPNKMQGYLLYDGQGYMSLHMTIENYQLKKLDFKDLSDSSSIEELKHRALSYNYMAAYKIDYDNKVVTHHRLSHSNPLEWNKSVKRSFATHGDTLILETMDRPNGKIRVTWLRQIQ
ncbi:MAG: lipocalin-like domain-containing protein [Vicingaceae bacterium]